MHNNHTPSFSVSKLSSDKSIPLVENILVENIPLGIQYDTGCQLSLISQSALQSLPKSTYSRGTSTRVRVLSYAGEGRVILTTEIKLKINGNLLKLSAIEEDLNNGSGFSFPVPQKWRSSTGIDISSHSGHISILLGGDNHLFFPTEIERDSQGAALFQSNLTKKFLIYSSISPNIITWIQPRISSSSNTV